MPFCKKCGAKYKDSSNFCSICGADVGDSEAKEDEIFLEDKFGISEEKDPIYDYGSFYASAWDRFWAFMIDNFLLVALYFIIMITISTMIPYPAITIIFEYYIYLILIGYYGYFVLFEGTKGQTIGKMLLHIKVIKEDRSQCDLVAAIIRNLLRIIDGIPGFYIIGVISISRSDKSQRIGDRIAKTVVVKSK
jgi:uncharacterized RDD family membrane protein YckC